MPSDSIVPRQPVFVPEGRDLRMPDGTPLGLGFLGAARFSAIKRVLDHAERAARSKAAFIDAQSEVNNAITRHVVSLEQLNHLDTIRDDVATRIIRGANIAKLRLELEEMELEDQVAAKLAARSARAAPPQAPVSRPTITAEPAPKDKFAAFLHDLQRMPDIAKAAQSVKEQIIADAGGEEKLDEGGRQMVEIINPLMAAFVQKHIEGTIPLMFEIGIASDGRRVSLTDKERARHIHILGSIGTGKSKLLEHMIRQDIAVGRGLCLLDPHGTLADKIEEWCALRGLGGIRRIHLVRPGDDRMVPGFNPLRAVPGEALSVRVDAMVGACAQAWGVPDMSETPRLEKILRATFYALAVRGLTLAEGPALLRASDPEGIRRSLTEALPDPMFQLTWDELNGMRRQDFAEYVESTITRLSKFLTAPAMRLVVGQQKHSIDFRKAMDEGEIVIVNLGSRHAFSYENARVLGTLLINDLFLTALSRDEAIAAKRPFTLYLDEAYDFLSPDIERILDQTRKFGLHAVLAHQRIGQIKARGEGVYNAVMGGTQTKIVLGGLGDDDASIMAREIMRGDVELATPKPGLTMPVVIGEEPFWLESESSSEGVSRNYSTTTGASSGEGKTETTSSVADGEEGSSTEGSSSTISETMSVTEGRSTSSSRTRGRSQTLRSIREERPAHLYSLEESFHLAALALRNLPDRAAIVKRRGHRTVRVETIEVKPMLKMPDTAARFRDMVCERSPFVVGIAAAEAEIRERQAALSPRRAESGSDDSSFWHEEA